MKKVDFSAAQLQGAWFVDSDLRRATFGCIDEKPGFTGLLMLAELFRRGEFETPRKECADLRRTWFVGSELQGSNFRGANLRGSLFDNSDLQGALLHYAHIQGAYFATVKLDGAELMGARLEGATLFGVRLRGASLEGAFLNGALLKDAELQGASLKEAALDGAQLNETYVWSADPRIVNSRAGVRVTAVITGPENPKHECSDYGMCNWSATQFGALKEQITQHTPAGACPPGHWKKGWC